MPSSKSLSARAGASEKISEAGSILIHTAPGILTTTPMKPPFALRLCSILSALAFVTAPAAPPAPHQAWTDPATAAREDADFSIQGEYRSDENAAAVGAQVVALGRGEFDIYLLDGGLPGAGWEPGKPRTRLRAVSKDGKISASDAATQTSATIESGRLTVVMAGNTKHVLARVQRSSPTLEARPPGNAIVLFGGTSTDQWENAKVENGHLLATGCTTLSRFKSYTLHLEFRTPYMPTARGQGRGNSGVYHSGRWETQILDSFGLEGRDNECGGIYSISKPRLNMCLPPLAWQTYDVEFTAAKFDESGNRTAWPRITVKLNGVVVHENLELAKDFTTSAPMSSPLTSPEGPVYLQNHNNPVVFRNVWIVPGQ